MDDLVLREWVMALDQISYYELFGVAPSAPYDEVRAAFHAFAESFHPDGHLGRPPLEQDAVGRIYRRGTEAWRVLSDPTMRARYDEAVGTGDFRPEALIVQIERPRSLAPPGAGRLIDKIRAPGARPFVLRAEELLKKGDPKQAKIQLVLALHMDRGNPALEAFAAELDRAIQAKTDATKRRG